MVVVRVKQNDNEVKLEWLDQYVQMATEFASTCLECGDDGTVVEIEKTKED